MAENSFFGMGIIAFIAVIIGLVLLGSVADTISSSVDTYSVTDRTVALINQTPVIVVASPDSLVAVSSVKRGGTTLGTGNYTVVTGVGGTVNLSGIVFDTGNYNLSYTYRDENYMSDGTARSIAPLITLFMTLGVLVGAIMYVDWRKIF